MMESVFSLEKYLKDTQQTMKQLRGDHWALLCEGKTRKEIRRLGFLTDEDWMVEVPVKTALTRYEELESENNDV